MSKLELEKRRIELEIALEKATEGHRLREKKARDKSLEKESELQILLERIVGEKTNYQELMVTLEQLKSDIRVHDNRLKKLISTENKTIQDLNDKEERLLKRDKDLKAERKELLTKVKQYEISVDKIKEDADKVMAKAEVYRKEIDERKEALDYHSAKLIDSQIIVDDKIKQWKLIETDCELSRKQIIEDTRDADKKMNEATKLFNSAESLRKSNNAEKKDILTQKELISERIAELNLREASLDKLERKVNTAIDTNNLKDM